MPDGNFLAIKTGLNDALIGGTLPQPKANGQAFLSDLPS